ncbi:rRNA pseudouridine synthase [Chryseobacterium daecheongense]|uniref:pseudouridine synthase n=1 Tax=Chryseobacterium daecheongense TaxID=192389 RepID=UPI001FD6D406|nr:pseudouridine synthase [Chryseobacterium daecheongense]UOU97563.1 rRNA pseudouridine synthase [Chryseobacterium daecheongense]
MSRDNNNSERPKRPRISIKKNSDSSRASKSGNSSGSKSFKKPFPKAGERNSDYKGTNSKFEKKPFKRSEDDGEERKSFGKPASKRGGRDFDSRDKYERGNLKFGKKPFNKNDRDDDRAKSFVQKRRLTKIDKDLHKDTIRLNKYIANSGICSRREADELITQGLVEVNGKVVTEMGYQVQKTDRVIFDGQNITPEKPVYVLLNKPKGYISTTKDDKARKTVMDLVANASPYRVFPVGRLDRSTTGVILLTNDGHMTKKLTHPSFNVKKIYHVTLDRKLSTEDMKTIAEGIRLEEGVATVDQISFIEGKPKNEVGIEIHIGWNRVIRRIFQRLGYEVEALDRVMFAGLTKKNIKRGHWRILTELEVNNLKML